MNRMMERSGSPGFTWLLALIYVCFLLNHMALAVLGWRTPLECLTGSTPDVSPLLRFHWWQPVYYKLDDSDFPSDTREKQGRFVGIVEHVGHAMKFKVLTDDTNKVIYRSNVRPADDPSALNLRLDLLDGEEAKFDFIKSVRDGKQDKRMMIIEPEYMIGRTFLGGPWTMENDTGQGLSKLLMITSRIRKGTQSVLSFCARSTMSNTKKSCPTTRS